MKKGNIILVPFYFTDFTSYKLRPSLIVSNGQSNPDDYIKKTSVLTCDKLMTINLSVVAGMLGELPTHIIKIIDKKLKTALLLQ